MYFGNNVKSVKLNTILLSLTIFGCSLPSLSMPVMPVLVHGERVPGLGHLCADIAREARRLHVLGLDVPRDELADGAAPAARRAHVHAVPEHQQARNHAIQI